ncbi:type I polyketide synthase, partial [Crocosphaera sp.]|uniref:type I polyketide synthase n=1 Tax=Crocosphaera sp. TaxID=2729996 RepID=UPI00260FB2D0
MTEKKLSYAPEQILQALQKASAKIESLESYQSEPIAIIGMGCRFPGNIDDPDSFWTLLENGMNPISTIPSDRWNINDYYDSDPEVSGKIYIKNGYFLEKIDEFDPLFFGISPREANSLDPQQRLLLEVAWEALENAGLSVSNLENSQTGVFVGIGQNDYGNKQLNRGNPDKINAYDGTGNGFCFASGRLSYCLGLQGPNLAVDTACSSSLVALHLACQSLRMRECNLAIAGGVQLILSPEITLFLCRTHALSPDGISKTFDASANGYGRGEGCGVVILKRLSDAIANQDNILAVIKGSSINHDGQSSGLTVPNGSAQQVVINQALKAAKVKPSQIDFIEAHGTGTKLGDPIEINALASVFGAEKTQEQPLIVGAVKSNIGHLEAAAGIASVIKVVLALQHQEIPRNLHFQIPNPYIDWEKIPIKVADTSIPWLSDGKTRLAGISSFGLSGTNAHLILEEAPIIKDSSPRIDRPLQLLTLSTKTETALRELVEGYQTFLPTIPEATLGNICYTSHLGRVHFEQRLAIIIQSKEQLQEQLELWLKNEPSPNIIQGKIGLQESSKIAFLFTGQGSQYVRMGRQLYETQPIFRSVVDQCNAILRPH